ncbi:MAG: 1,4-dihydroxy-2-naphthoate octaprenyltransferase [Bacteroidales bacterium]|nr:1,4-dihydroxy-2-naphthoate octaprenyltransferase [Bacteroidales bacterium]
MKRLKLWFSIIRPKTLFASLIPVLIGIVILKDRLLSTEGWLLTSMVTLLCGLSLQVLSNLINDYYDYKKGTDKKNRVGFKRALAEGKVTASQMKKAIYLNLVFSFLSGAYLCYVGGLPIVIIGISSLLFAWLYTATPYSLSYLGIADIFAFLYYGPVACCGTTYLLTKEFSTLSFFAGCVCGCVSVMILTVNNLRDMKSDRENRKKSFEVRFGKCAGETKYLIAALLMSVFSFLAFGLSIVCAVVIFSLSLYFKLRKTSGKDYNKLLFLTSLLNLVYFVLVIIFLFCYIP